ncbi:MAG: beta-ketoacyl-ACP synthase II [Desulfobacterales bacterium]|nr:beta-ketoacyl-ACP synthase II [Desulfobacterales bacterium]
MVDFKRIVVTGMGVVSPLGLDVSSTWQGLVDGRSGVGPITLFDAGDLKVRIAGEVRGFDAKNYMSAKEARRADRFVHFAVAALREALEQSRLEVNESNAYDVGVIIGSGQGGVQTHAREFKVMLEKGARRVTPFVIPMIVVDAASVQVALLTGARGPNFGVSSACATGAHAIGQAYETIRQGHARAVITGGVEAPITTVGVMAFDRMRALSRRNDDPAGASRPFDADRDGFVMSEGGAVLVLEELEFALARGAEPLAELVGYATTSDAIHLTTPDPDGAGAAHCMKLAMERAGVTPGEASYINAHGTSTPSGDPAETRAMKLALGEFASTIPISSTKSMTGHLLGGAGALEAAICIEAMARGVIPPTINLQTPDPTCDLDYTPNKAREASLDVVLSNAFGFGGHNTTLIFKRPPAA